MPIDAAKREMRDRRRGEMRKRVVRRRAPNLNEERIETIVAIIRGWQGRLTWQALCETVARRVGARYTRQALHNHTRIRAAYEVYRQEARPSAPNERLSAAERRVLELQREIRELEKVRDTLLEKFARWSYNASLRGLDENFLDQPLPRIDRR